MSFLICRNIFLHVWWSVVRADVWVHEGSISSRSDVFRGWYWAGKHVTVSATLHLPTASLPESQFSKRDEVSFYRNTFSTRQRNFLYFSASSVKCKLSFVKLSLCFLANMTSASLGYRSAFQKGPRLEKQKYYFNKYFQALVSNMVKSKVMWHCKIYWMLGESVGSDYTQVSSSRDVASGRNPAQTQTTRASHIICLSF